MNNRYTLNAAVLAILCIAFSGCTPAKQQGTQRATDKEPYRVSSEGEVPPLDDSDVVEEADVEETPVEEAPIYVEEAEAPVDTTTTPPPPKTIDGFRVQVFASSAEDVARNAAGVARERLGVEAYVELVEGMYKVRVGDCATREAAETLLARCRKTYYRDAWIVETPVRADRAADSTPPGP